MVKVVQFVDCAIDIMKDLVSKVLLGVIIAGNMSIFGGSARCYFTMERLLQDQFSWVVHRVEVRLQPRLLEPRSVVGLRPI